MAVLEIEKAITSILKNSADVAALVGTRVYAFRLPQNATLPAITYHRVSTYRLITHDQTSTGLSNPRFQFNLYANSIDVCKQMSAAVRKAFLGYQAEVGTTTKVSIYAILPESEIDIIEADLDLYYTMVDYKFSHNE